MIRKLVVLCSIMVVMASCAFAETLPDEMAAKDLSDKIMKKVSVEDIDAAFNIMKQYVPLSATEIDSAKIQTKNLREQYGNRYGSSVGYEFIDSKKVGDSLIRIRYIEKTNKHALPWSFYFYRTNDGWILNTFDWNDQIKPIFIEE